ncbi:Crp/Fnr family transcriptional regulator [Schleiferia thermophila]|jgi:CRP-like cAMP-binding protein|uniref:CRP-like cAMP-binding protein n=1 Tax=Schleiferia thermophila TaxID=884107 RepID=A0A369A3K6_9FLAO|nr:Crp/Fnr family transcriptional regulator [Schleiferia thermophila]KFD39653.1 Crp/Fnr family transcriptional regulator [Schleiferia thermophila str. Yellowstone]RCX03819.1 CRP-like cAMP-binding protein [Schleiferia thermophila]GCD80051.1 Crp/Fnr family transcriptional regulator [Schleiferia thermophila]
MKSDIPLSCNTCVTFKISQLRALHNGELDFIEREKGCSFFKKGQTLLVEGSRNNGVYCIHKGKVKITRMGPEGKEQIIRFGKEGDLIGYRSLLSGEPVSASVYAMEETHACFLPKHVLFHFIQSNPAFTLDLMKLACKDLGDAGKIITNLAQKSVRERLAEVLLIIYNTFGEDEEGCLNVTITREEIANMVGTATETVIRLLSEFKDDHLIENKGRKIKLLNRRELAHIGNVYDY